MKKLLILLTILLATQAFSQVKLGKSELSKFTPEDLLSFNRLSDPQISPDGKWVLYTLGTPSIEENKVSKDIYAISIDGTDIKKLTDHPSSDFHARWIDGGKKIAFLSTRMGSPQIFTKDFPKGAPRGLTTIVGGISTFRYSPDGSLIAFTSNVKMKETISDKYPNLRKSNVLAYTDLPTRHWDHWEDENVSHLFLMPAKGGPAVDIMEKEPYDVPLQPFGGTEDYYWNPNSTEITYSCKKVDDYEVSTNTDLYVYNLKTKATRNITDGMLGYDKHPVYSPDGKMIAFTSQERAGFEADKVRLMAYDLTTNAITDLTASLDQWVSQFTWSPDSKTIYFSATENGTEPLFKVDVATQKVDKLLDGMYNYSSGIDISSDGNTMVIGRTSMQEPLDLYKVDLTAEKLEAKRLSFVNSNIWVKIKEVKIEERQIESTDGKNVHTWVLYPPDFDPNKKYPMITYCQGGPQGQISHYFSYRWNLYLMASQGYVVCAPNRRGMPGFGQEWCDQISQDWGGQAMDDILEATKAVAEEPFVDNSKLACVGPSFGGYSVFWLAGNHEGLFSCFISHCGVFNLESMYGSTEELFFPNWEFGGPYWVKENAKQYEKFSPHRYVENWDTPMLVITGVYDFRVPYTQSLEAYTVLQSKNIDSKLLVFPDENHWVLSLQNALVWQSEFFEWLDTHVGQ